MKEVQIIASGSAQEALEAAATAWDSAMAQVPAFLRNRLNLHQIQSVPAITADIDAKFADARKALAFDGPLSAEVVLDRGVLSYRYRRRP